MIGVFDSGFGGLQTLKYLKELYPSLDYTFLADSANVPYGNRDPQWIQERTFACLDWLFDQGSVVIILACNTSSAYSIRKRQSQYPDKKVLSITIPGIEKAVSMGYKNISILATSATIISGIYNELFDRIGTGNCSIQGISAIDIVPLIEQGIQDGEQMERIVKKYVDMINPNTDGVILGCTHFPIIFDVFQRFHEGPYIDPGYESAIGLDSYLSRHPEIYDRITKTGRITFFTTGDPDKFQEIGQKIRPETGKAVQVVI